MTSAGDTLSANQSENFGLFLYKLFRQGFITEAEVLADNRFRVVPKDGQAVTAMHAVQLAVCEPYDRLKFTFVWPDKAAE